MGIGVVWDLDLDVILDPVDGASSIVLII